MSGFSVVRPTVINSKMPGCPISYHWSLFVAPENIRKPCFLIFLVGIERDRWNEYCTHILPDNVTTLGVKLK